MEKANDPGRRKSNIPRWLPLHWPRPAGSPRFTVTVTVEPIGGVFGAYNAGAEIVPDVELRPRRRSQTVYIRGRRAVTVAVNAWRIGGARVTSTVLACR